LHTQPTSIKKSVNNDVWEQKNYYPHDLMEEGIGEFYDLMVNRNIVNIPVKKETWKNQTMLSMDSTYYYPNGGNVLPKTIYTQNNGSDLENRLTYHRYDSHDNPFEISREGGSPTAIIWDDFGRMPIAVVSNASYNSVWYTSFENTGSVLVGASQNVAH
jgi:hypothetical protein